MILLDTNVVSELMRLRPEARVTTFLAARRLETPFLPSLVVVEIHYGLARLPDRSRCSRIETLFERSI